MTFASRPPPRSDSLDPSAAGFRLARRSVRQAPPLGAGPILTAAIGQKPARHLVLIGLNDRPSSRIWLRVHPLLQRRLDTTERPHLWFDQYSRPSSVK
ncbi:hypothetical protein chiPu_0021035 [Chiloscyllium punctatum]|uniref:Uncharacterized protein n=1 Tax=Chiloscyllium punctatum TaxID=137246 RepID=A0A401RMD1_CHIPU|nr:hypothetical protein [Chiloscyllium punctatum]